jgi:predicted molibdopterin-dependent oxidoreductase YjgC
LLDAHSPGSEFQIEVDGQLAPAKSGDTVAAALVRAGVFVLRYTQRGEPRGLFCGMGVCFECSVTIDGVPGQRACVTAARPGMRVDTGKGRVN